jgi:hypothetical protein
MGEDRREQGTEDRRGESSFAHRDLVPREVLPSRRACARPDRGRGMPNTRTEHVGQPPPAVESIGYRLPRTADWFVAHPTSVHLFGGGWERKAQLSVTWPRPLGLFLGACPQTPRHFPRFADSMRVTGAGSYVDSWRPEPGDAE